MTLITVAGNSGVGKTTLVTALAASGIFALGLEQHAERPFQNRFGASLAEGAPRFALANQVDYLLLRAEQEWALRREPRPGLMDGGLDLDYFLFTRRFHQMGYLDDAEFALCTRLHTFLRESLGPPDLILYLSAPLDLIRRRRTQRGRPVDIAKLDDLDPMQDLLDEWIATVTACPVLTVDASHDDFTGPDVIARLLDQIAHRTTEGSVSSSFAEKPQKPSKRRTFPF